MTDYTQAPAGRSDAPAAARPNGLAVAGLVCGVIGLLFAAPILGPLAIIFGGVGLARARSGARYRGLALAGLILGIVDLVLWLVLLAVMARHGGSMFFRFG